MDDINTLIKDLISKKNNIRAKSFEHEKTFKKCTSILNGFHALEINPRQVNEEIKKLCFKLDIHSLDHKAKYLKSLCERVIQLCNDYLDRDNYLLSYSVILFLIEIHESMVHDSYEENTVDAAVIQEFDVVDWGHILQHSDDIVSMSRDDYGYDTSSSESCNFEEENKIENDAVIEVVDRVKYDVVSDHGYCTDVLESTCQANLQSEYWTSNNSDRIVLTEYQFVREVLDVLQGARLCTIWRLLVDPVSIAACRYSVSKTCRLSNLSPGVLDSISESLATVASNCLRLRLVSQYIIDNSSRLSIAAPLIALGEHLHGVMDEVEHEMRQWENRARGDIGMGVLDLVNHMTRWCTRLSVLSDLVVCVTNGGRYDALECHSIVVTALDCLYNLMNETCLIGMDQWTVTCVHTMFYDTLRPYLYLLDSLLSGQGHVISAATNRGGHVTNDDGHVTSASGSGLFLDHNDTVPRTRHHLARYYHHYFTIKKAGSIHQSQIHTTIPLLLHPFIVHLVSTIKAIDLLSLLSVELTKPAIVQAIVKQPGSFINHLKRTPTTVPLSGNTEPRPDVTNLSVTQQIYRDLVIGQSKSHNIETDQSQSQKSKTDQSQLENIKSVDHSIPTNEISPNQPATSNDLVSVCRQLHHTLLLDISQRYSTVNTHLINVYISTLGLSRTLATIRAVYFLQAGVEMYDVCCHLFECVLSNSCDNVSFQTNLKLQQVLCESQNSDLRDQSSLLSVSLTPALSAANGGGAVIGTECDRMMALLSSVTIEYRVHWSLALIVTGSVIDTCNQCLRFLVHVRFAKHCLETAIHGERYRVRERDAHGLAVFNRMVALRLKLLQIINSLHSYVMNTFIVPLWHKLDAYIAGNIVDEFGDFVCRVNEPLLAMAKGCLQTPELDKFRKAIYMVISLSVRTALIDRHDNYRLRDLETEYRRLVDFISAMFQGLSNMGLSINGLDMSAFR